MSFSRKSMIENLRGLWIYNLSFVILFDFIFLRRFTDSSQTTLVFIIISVILQIWTLALFALVIEGIKLFFAKPGILIKAILLFLVSEISVLFLTEHIPLFGLFERQDYDLSKDIDKFLIIFQKGRDFALSTCGFLSSIIYFLFIRFRDRTSLNLKK
jgi:hypothetical protein